MKNYLLFIGIILLAFFLRFNNLNWDNNFHLHPDERFLTMVAGDMKIPKNIGEYLDPTTSPMNPANINYKFFVYGVFPLVLNKLLAVLFNNNDYNMLTIQGRFLSGLADLLTLFFVYKIVEFFEEKYRLNKRIKYLAAFFYATAVLPIQLSHFFAVDTFLTLFMIGSFYFALRSNILVSAVFMGFAIACKINAVVILPLNLYFIFLLNNRKSLSLRVPLSGTKQSGEIIIYILIIYFILRFADPYIFNNNNFFDPRLNPGFVSSVKSLKSFEGKDIWYPPGIQWINKPAIVFSLINLAFFGVGLLYFIFIILGIIWTIKKFNVQPALPAGRRLTFNIILLWVFAFFLYQSTQFVKAMRYFIFIYPFLAMFAAFGLNWITEKVKSYKLQVASIILLLIWPLSFSSIYLRPVSRVSASEWIYENIENNTFILSESWDDPLPLPVENMYGKRFTGEQLPVFDPDTPEKWQKINSLLEKADYYILSSNRGWGSIPTVPEKYPQMSKFYNELLSGKNKSYQLIKEFSSRPSICSTFHVPCSMLNDDWADESFTVYDHPKVLIFKNINKQN